MSGKSTRISIAASLVAVLLSGPVLTITAPAEARSATRTFTYKDRRGDAPKGFDILRVDGNVSGNTLSFAVKIRGLTQWGMLQVGTNSPDQQNLFQIYHDDYGQLRLAAYHRDAWSPFSKWYAADDCSAATFTWTRGRAGWISATIPMNSCGRTNELAEASTTLALVNFQGAGPKRRDSVGSIPGGGW